jgi:DNA primase
VARFDDVWLSELYAKNDIVDVISSYTTLTERGGRYWGLCPFHHEKTPSFSVSRDRQLYYCFGCKQGGNVANFVMKADSLTFGEAVEMLARRVGMQVPQAVEDKEYREIKDKKKKIADMHRLAARYYFDTLHSPAGMRAMEYLKRRGISEEDIRRFGLGFAPDNWDSVARLLEDNGYPQALIGESGLVSVKNGKSFDTFRSRVMFPIINVFGEVIAFGGRVIGDGEPKYLNTRDTLLFNKRRNLYGIDLLRKQRNIKSAVIVEGYMDVVSLCAHGVKAAVASLGTALTREQAVLLKRYTENVYLSYDGDIAGEIATGKALGILEAEGLDIRVIRYEEGMDPDDFIRKYGLKGFAAKVKAAIPPDSYRLEIAKKGFDLNTEDGREGYAQAASAIIARMDSSIRRERYAEQVSGETGYSVASIMDGRQRLEPEKNTNANNRYNSIEKSVQDDAEGNFLAYAMACPQLLGELGNRVSPELFEHIVHKNIFYALYDSVKRGIQPTYAELLSELEDEEARSEAARLAQILTVADDPLVFMQDCLTGMRLGALEKRREDLKEELRQAQGDRKRQLLAEIGELNKELKQIKG